MIRSIFSCRNYAAAAKAKKAVKEKSGPTKQILMKNKKSSAASSSSSGPIGVNRLAPLTQALFNVDPDCVQAAEASQADHAEMHRRHIIDMAWHKLQLEKSTEQAEWEHGFLSSKTKALTELRKANKKLYASAIVYDYSIAPIHQRPATLTPPSLDKFPYTQEFSEMERGNNSLY